MAELIVAEQVRKHPLLSLQFVSWIYWQVGASHSTHASASHSTHASASHSTCYEIKGNKDLMPILMPIL